jgi:hypothetical protein
VTVADMGCLPGEHSECNVSYIIFTGGQVNPCHSNIT